LDLAGGVLIVVVPFWKAFAVLFWGQSAMTQQVSRVCTVIVFVGLFVSVVLVENLC
jgi:hypothetical protein